MYNLVLDIVCDFDFDCQSQTTLQLSWKRPHYDSPCLSEWHILNLSAKKTVQMIGLIHYDSFYKIKIKFNS